MNERKEALAFPAKEAVTFAYAYAIEFSKLLVNDDVWDNRFISIVSVHKEPNGYAKVMWTVHVIAVLSDLRPPAINSFEKLIYENYGTQNVLSQAETFSDELRDFAEFEETYLIIDGGWFDENNL